MVRPAELVEYGAASPAPGIVSRPVLHRVRTPGGALITGAEPQDHPWHRGIGLGLPDVDGINLWGGPSYVPGLGYDPSRTVPGLVRSRDPGSTRTDAGIEDELEWCSPDGAVLLSEQRRIELACEADLLRIGWHSVVTAAVDLTIASPASGGRTGAGYGGFFWRLPEVEPGRLRVRTPSASGDSAVNGAVAPWLELTVEGSWRARLTPADERTAADPWFVRTEEYAGVGSSLAAPRALRLEASETVTIAIDIEIEDLDEGRRSSST